MARLFAEVSFDIDNLNLYRLVATGVYSDLYDDVYVTVNGITYRDVFEVVWADGDMATYFGGNSITYNYSTGAITGGTVTSLLEYYYDWSSDEFLISWGIEGISVSAKAIFDAARTSSTSDDYTLLRAALSSNDSFSLSEDGDRARGYGGNDTMYGFGGDDLLYGGDADDEIYGGNGDDRLYGEAGNDTLDGGDGADRLEGGTGNDIYILATDGDTILEASGAGTDEVRSGYSYTLGANLENLLLTGTIDLDGTGNSVANVITGNGAANVLSGLGGNDTLDGGDGADRLEGGLGNDVYILATAGDTVVEASGAGTDQVRAGYSYTLEDNLENLLLTGTTELDGTGNSLANVITGNGAANELSGLDGNDTLKGLAGSDTLDGGAGADRLEGGTGNDVYILASAGDTVVEASGGGTDEVRAGYSYTLGSYVENLRLTGTGAINGTGNSLANVLTGNEAANILKGLGGNDILVGLDGNDTLSGGDGVDLLIGGAGQDLLTGGTGNDAFEFGSSAEGGDLIADFSNVSGNNDVFRISAAGFGSGLVAGQTLASSQFQTRTDNLAQDGDDRFIFRTTDKTLWFDEDGIGGAGAVLIADLQATATLTSADILLV